jgi:hypothetical protein
VNLREVTPTGKNWFLALFVLPTEEHVDVAVRELVDVAGLPVSSDLTMRRIEYVRVQLPDNKVQLVNVYVACIPPPNETKHMYPTSKGESTWPSKSTACSITLLLRCTVFDYGGWLDAYIFSY